MSCDGSCTCGACQRPGGPLVAPENRPSLPAIAYRRGRFGSFRAALLAQLGVTPELAGLTARTPDDHAIALIEAWAVVGDVLSFYTERYANESFLGTATQSRSLERLARLVGYRRRPGAAALAWLAFDAEAGQRVALAAGTAVQSVPPPPSDPTVPPPLPQTFETLVPAVADARLNRLRAYSTAGPGAAVGGAGQTTATLDRVAAPTLAEGLAPRAKIALFQAAVEKLEVAEIAEVVEGDDFLALRWANELAGTAGAGARAFRTTRTLGLFGASAPATFMQPKELNTSPKSIVWQLVSTTGLSVAPGTTTLDLDSHDDTVASGTRLLFVSPGQAPKLVTVSAVSTATPTIGPLTGTVTRLTVSPNLPAYQLATARALVLEGPELKFWGEGYPTVALGDEVWLPVFRADPVDGRPAVEVGRRIVGRQFVPGAALPLDQLAEGQVLMLAWAGEPGSNTPPPVVVRLATAPAEPAFTASGFGHLRLDLRASDGSGPPDVGAWTAVAAVDVLGNVARASHGESVVEVLGDGQGSRPFPRFTLRRSPLTYLPAAVPGGLKSTLSVYVDGVRRDEVRTLYGQRGSAPVVEVTTLPDGSTQVMGGDDRTGARLTTGTGNVQARYRVGSGLVGRVPAGSLTTLLTKPVGLKSAVNPLPAEGGADPEPVEDVRQRAPASVRTLGRAVSLRDIEDQLLTAALAVKAQAVWLWNGLDRFVHVTVAAPEGAALSSELRATLAGSLDSVRDPSYRIVINDFVPVEIVLHASVVIDQRVEDPKTVLDATEAAARAFLSFDRARLGGAVALSDVVAALASVTGVVGVDVDQLGFAAGQTAAQLDARGVERRADGSVAPVQSRLRAFRARPLAGGAVKPAELLLARSTGDVAITDGGRA
jgi:hypothetical protein